MGLQEMQEGTFKVYLPHLSIAGTTHTEKLNVHITNDRGTAILGIIDDTDVFALILKL